MTAAEQAATEGRIVHVRSGGIVHCQPAIVVRAWGTGTGALNLVVFRDGSNDAGDGCPETTATTRWATSVGYAATEADHIASGLFASWHWPQGCDGRVATAPAISEEEVPS